MKKITLSQLLLFLFFVCQYGYSQVDVVYNDLVWSDEFDNNGAANSSKWFPQTQIPSGGNWFNNEEQHYTNRLVNSFVNNGNLNIVAKRETFTDQNVTKQFTSARLNSKFAFKYGRVDIRAKAPNNPGTWPALWLLGKNVNEDGGFFDANFGTTGWPACGEIDIMEHGIFPGQPVNYVGSAIHTPSSSGNTVNKGGIQASDIALNYHVYSMNWSPNQITFLLDNVAYYTYNPSVKNASTWPFDAEQYLLLNIAMGGFAGAIPSNFTQTSMIIDYVRVYQNVALDTEAPTNFTASVGEVTGVSVQLNMNATDNSGTVAYTVSYGSESTTIYNPSGQLNSLVIPNLSPNTNYTFTITATDLAGNTVGNNTIVLNATTSEVLQCSGTDLVASEGTFTTGYNHTFQTIGSTVKITFELLDQQVGVVAFLRRQTPFNEVQMDNVSGQVFTKTITGQTLGSTINYAVKFAYAGGLSVTKYVSYLVGSNCPLGVESVPDLVEFNFPNPSNTSLNISSKVAIDKVEIFSLVGNMVLSVSRNTNKVDISQLQKGVYILNVYSGSSRTTKKLIID